MSTMPLTRTDTCHLCSCKMDSDDVGHPMMLEARGVKVRYTRHDYLNCSAVEVPLRGGVITLLMITPDHIDDMGLLEDRLSAQRIADIMATMQISRANLKVCIKQYRKTLLIIGDHSSISMFCRN